MKSIFIAGLSAGDTVDDFFALRKVELREFQTGKMISLELGDRSGRIKGVMWTSSADTLKSLSVGEVYRIKGTVTTYKNEIQVTVESAVHAEKYDPRDFLPVGPFTREELDKRLAETIESISDTDYRALLLKIFGETEFREGFLAGVGGKLWHHNYIGGLAEHTLSVCDLCHDFSLRYKELDRDLIISGALLHDIGKVDSYSLGNYIDYSDTGRLIGHIVIGDEIVKNAVSRLPDFPAEKSLKIRHLVLSHQGSPEQSSPVSPMMAEGIALYIADLLDSKLAALRRIRLKENRPGVRWSNYVNLLDRYIYFGDVEDEKEAP